MKVFKSCYVYAELFFLKKRFFFLADRQHKGVKKLVTICKRQKYVKRYVK